MKKKYKVKKAQVGFDANLDKYLWNDEQLIPGQHPSSVVSQNDATMTDIYGNTNFKNTQPNGPELTNTVPISKSFKTFQLREKENPYVTGFNALATGVTGLANVIQNNKLMEEERKNMLHSLIPDFIENSNGDGLNNIPAYTKMGGKCKYPYGGGPLTSEGAKEILRDGTVNKKKLTAKQKRYFGWVAGGKKQMGGDNEMMETHGLPKNYEAYANVEVEEGEIIKEQNGGLLKVADNAGTHEQGGVKLAGVERVLEDTGDKRKDTASKLLKLSPDEIEEMFGIKVKGSVTHAKAFEIADKHYDKQKKKIDVNQKELNDRPKLDKLAVKSAELNYKTMQDMPTKDDVFDALFTHQEIVKNMNNIQDDGTIGKSKYSAKAQAGTAAKFRPYYDRNKKINYTPPTDITPEQFYTPEVVAYMNTLDKMQGVDNDLGLAKDNTWGYRHQMAYDKFFAGPGAKASVSASIMPQNAPVSKTSNSLDTSVNINPNFIKQPDNSFHEPTYWDEIAPGALSLVDSLNRTPELYNPVEIGKLRYKQLDPTAALNANQADYEAGLDTLGQNNIGAGVTAANIANLQAGKYAANSQVMSQYDNQNAQIKNNETTYNTNAGDRKSVADASARGKYYSDVQVARENQRQQRLTAIQDISRVIQMKRRQNASGNLLLKLSPAFNQRGEYNGYQYNPTIPSDHYLPDGYTSDNQITSKGKKYRVIKDASGREVSREEIK